MVCYPWFRQTAKRLSASLMLGLMVFFVSHDVAVTAAAAGAQAVASVSTTIVMRLVDTIRSATDPPGKQYRAVVAQATTAGSVSIPLNTGGRITLAQSGGNWSAQLTSLSLNGQMVLVTSSGVSATSPLQQARQGVQKLGGLLGGLGGLGNRVAPPMTAVANAIPTGPNVVLAAGTVLTFTASVPQPLAQASAGSNAGQSAAPVASGAVPVVANATNVAARQAGGGPVGFCEILVGSPSPGAQARLYISAIFDVPNDNDRYKWEQAWGYYVQARDKNTAYSNGGGCTFSRTRTGAQQYLQNRKNNLAGAKLIETGWVYTGPEQLPPPVHPNPANGK
ncbi:MAG TPA: hypothetical protein VJ738_04985 [Steroidobacteraceae bacterium]|nr:hypothetical protein [Steroidobacteraceae bacterium]